tara:strand:- start:266 stop:460 length:195 start_codon:yes stop_codon:yes gene_type:complete
LHLAREGALQVVAVVGEEDTALPLLGRRREAGRSKGGERSFDSGTKNWQKMCPRRLWQRSIRAQ